MRRLFVGIFCIFAFFSTQSIASQCSLDISSLAAKSQTLTNSFSELPDATATSAFFQNNDDPRIVVSLGLTKPTPISGMSLTAYVKSIENQFSSYIASVKDQGRGIEMTTFPGDPLSWRIIEEAKLPNVGPSIVGRMFIRLNDSCLLTANYVAPSSINLRSKWQAMADAIVALRTDLQSDVKPAVWGPEDTTPTGSTALLIGVFSPLACSLIGYFLLGHFTRLDSPSVYTKIVLACISLVMAGSVFFLHGIFSENLKSLKYTDELILMSVVFVLCAGSLIFGQAMTVLALVTSCITGITMISLAFFGWVPNVGVAFSVGVAVMIMSVLGFVSWTFGASVEANSRVRTSVR